MLLPHSPRRTRTHTHTHIFAHRRKLCPRARSFPVRRMPTRGALYALYRPLLQGREQCLPVPEVRSPALHHPRRALPARAHVRAGQQREQASLRPSTHTPPANVQGEGLHCAAACCAGLSGWVALALLLYRFARTVQVVCAKAQVFQYVGVVVFGSSKCRRRRILGDTQEPCSGKDFNLGSIVALTSMAGSSTGSRR